MARVKTILIGGFLGAGKTTLLARAAERLGARGLKVGLITNDQAANLVDTELLRQAGREVKEVSGACFCCAFNKLLYVCDNLISTHNPDVILGEPVGSCTDLSATVLQPLKKFCSERFDLAPYSVLVDPDKLQESLSVGQTHDVAQAVRYIYRKQIEEADLVVINKTDSMLPARLAEIKVAIEKEFPAVPVVTMSASDGTGVDGWLDRVMSGGYAGGRIVEVDYEIYAEGEAALGWLNSAVELSANTPADWNTFGVKFLKQSQAEIERIGGEIAHFKILLTAAGGRLQANLTSNAQQPAIKDNLKSPSTYATLIVNARVRMGPDELKEVVKNCLARAAENGVTVNIAEISSFRPGRPQPAHRFDQVIDTAATED